VKTVYHDEWRVSPRVVLRRGDKFRVSGGPYWRTPDGAKVRMAARGVMKFVRAAVRGKVVMIEAHGEDGFTVLHIEGRRRNRVDPALVCRPYRITGRVRSKGAA
jgi:hypothetical protein